MYRVQIDCEEAMRMADERILDYAKHVYIDAVRLK